MDSEQTQDIKNYPKDKAWQAKARKHQSDFRKREMNVDAVQNTRRSKCYGNVISEKDAATGVIFCPQFRDEIMQDIRIRKQDIRTRKRKKELNNTNDMLTNILRSEHIPYNIFFPMKHDLAATSLLFQKLTARDIKTIRNIIIEYAPSPEKEYLGDGTSFDVFVDYLNSKGGKCGIGIEVKYTEMGYTIGSKEERNIMDKNSNYYKVTHESGCFDYDGLSEEKFIVQNFGNHKRGDNLRQIWRNHILGLSMMQHEDGLDDFLSIHLYPSFNEHFNPRTNNPKPSDPKTRPVLLTYTSLLSKKGRNSFMPLTYETLFEAMKDCGMDKIDKKWIPYLVRRYII